MLLLGLQCMWRFEQQHRLTLSNVNASTAGREVLGNKRQKTIVVEAKAENLRVAHLVGDV